MAPTVTPHTLLSLSFTREIFQYQVYTHTTSKNCDILCIFFHLLLFHAMWKILLFSAHVGKMWASERKCERLAENFHLTCVGKFFAELSSIFQIRSSVHFSVSFQRSSINVCLVFVVPQWAVFSVLIFSHCKKISRGEKKKKKKLKEKNSWNKKFKKKLWN